jgi:hypothetical protein
MSEETKLYEDDVIYIGIVESDSMFRIYFQSKPTGITTTTADLTADQVFKLSNAMMEPVLCKVADKKIKKREKEMSKRSLREFFEHLRHSDVFHIGAGDIRLTHAMQDEMVNTYDPHDGAFDCDDDNCKHCYPLTNLQECECGDESCPECSDVCEHTNPEGCDCLRSQPYEKEAHRLWHEEHENDVCKCGDHECPDAHNEISTSIEFKGNYAKKETIMALHAEEAFKLLERTSAFFGVLINENNGIGTKPIELMKETIDNLLYKVGYNEN